MQWLNKFRALFHKAQAESELDDELRFHLEKQIEQNIANGMSAEEARYTALRIFGGVEQVKEECREAWGVRFIEELVQDVRYGLRQLRRNPGFTAVAVLTLALGIGANTAVFSVVNALLLHPEPYTNPAQLVEITEKSPQGEPSEASIGDFTDWEAQNQAFQGMAAYQQWEFHTLTGAGQPDEVWTSPVSANLFRLLGINPALGRTFVANEGQTAIVSYQYWRSHFSSNSKIIGKTLALDGKPYTVVGVAPADFEFPDPNTQIWVPFAFKAFP